MGVFHYFLTLFSVYRPHDKVVDEIDLTEFDLTIYRIYKPVSYRHVVTLCVQRECETHKTTCRQSV